MFPQKIKPKMIAGTEVRFTDVSLLYYTVNRILKSMFGIA